LGWRPSDLDSGYNPFLLPDTTGVAIGMSDPVLRAQWASEHGGKEPGEASELKESSPCWDRIIFPGVSHSWEDLKFLKENWDGKSHFIILLLTILQFLTVILIYV
jgi:lactate 2-monooxygenase